MSIINLLAVDALNFVLFCAAFIIVLIVPGFLTLYSIRIKLIAPYYAMFSVVLSIAVISIFSYFTSLFLWPFNIWVYLGLVAALAVIALIRDRVAGDGHWRYFLTKEFLDDINWLYILIPMAVMVLVLFAGFRGFSVPPHNDDASSHITFIHNILVHESTVQTVVRYSNSWYPLGFHSIAALIAKLVPLPVQRLGVYVVFALTIWVPVVIMYISELFTKRRGVGLAGGAVSAIFYLFPYHLYAWGGWPQLLGHLLLWTTVGALWCAITNEEDNTRYAVLAGILIVGIYYFHTSELVSVAIVYLGLSPFIPWRKNWRKIAVAAAVVAGLFVLTIPSFSLLFGTTSKLGSIERLGPPAAFSWGGMILQMYHSLNRWPFYAEFTSDLLLMPIAALGILYSFIKRKRLYIAIFIIQMLFLGLATDAKYWQILRRFYDITYPWSQAERVFYHQEMFICFFAGVFLVAVVEFLRNRLDRPMVKFGFAPALSLIFAMAVMASLFANSQAISTSVDANTGVAPADITAMAWIKSHTPANAMFFNDFMQDAGPWITAVSDRAIYMPPNQFYGSWRLKCDTLYGANKLVMTADGMRSIRRQGVSYFYSGPKTVAGRDHIVWLSALYNSPYLDLVYRRDGVYIFKISDSALTSDTQVTQRTPTKLDVGTLYDQENLTGGWDKREVEDKTNITYRWTRGRAELMMSAKPDRAFTLTVRAMAPTKLTGPITVDVYDNDLKVGGFIVAGTGWKDYAVALPVQTGSAPIKLAISSRVWSPQKFGLPDARKLGIAIDRFGFEYK